MVHSPWEVVFAVTVMHDDIQPVFHPSFCDYDLYAQRLRQHAIDSLPTLSGFG